MNTRDSVFYVSCLLLGTDPRASDSGDLGMDNTSLTLDRQPPSTTRVFAMTFALLPLTPYGWHLDKLGPCFDAYIYRHGK